MQAFLDRMSKLVQISRKAALREIMRRLRTAKGSGGDFNTYPGIIAKIGIPSDKCQKDWTQP